MGSHETKPLVLAGKYELREVLGEGSSGLVYLAWDKNLERYVAIKAAKAEEGQLKQEMEMLRRLKHSMLPEIYDYFYEDNWYLVLEYIEGIGLHKVIEREERITERQVCEWGKQLLTLFSYLHSQKPAVIYRDLKPENIIVCPDGSLRLIDFGAALQLNYIGKSQESLAGSIGYAAPEQFVSAALFKNCAYQENKADVRSDIYTIGAVFYHMLTGFHPAKPPYGIYPVRFLNPAVSAAMEELVAKCTQKNPTLRYQTIEELQTDLEKVSSYRICGKESRQIRGRHKREKKRNSREICALKRMEKQIWLTEKKSVGLMGISMVAVILLTLALFGSSVLAKMDKPTLPVAVYNGEGQKLVIRYNSIYAPKGKLVFELGKELFAKEGMQELSVCLTDCATGEKKERIFYLKGESEGAEGKQLSYSAYLR